MKRISSTVIYLFLSFFLICCSLWILLEGESPFFLHIEEIKARLAGLSREWNPLLDERLPRLIVILCTGASLAVSGAIMQALFHNPLASPSILGISTGGCLLVVLVFIFNLHLVHPAMIPIAAVFGSLLTLCLVYVLSHFQEKIQVTHLILTGIALSTILLSIEGMLLYAHRDQWQLIQTITEWEAGSTLDRSWKHVHMQLPLTIVGLAVSLYYRNELNLLSLGEEEARNLGVDIETVRWRLFLSVAILTGGALAAIGIIAFFGLILPHILRHLQGPDHRSLIPLCIVGGASVFLFLDLSLRIFQFYFISIGNLSAVLGGLFFLILLTQTQRRGRIA